MYLRDYRRFPPVVVSTIGFRKHGKAVLLGSVFHTLMHRRLGEQWSGFNWLAVNEESLDNVIEVVDTLHAGSLPDSTAQTFPRPTLVRLRGVPHHPDCTLLWYDAAGESFEHASQLVNFASFVAHSRCVMFLLSLPDCAATPRGTAVEMHRLLNTYLLGRAELGGQPREQHLIVTFTKGDTLPQIAPDWAPGWLDDDDDYSPASHHLRELRETSRYLRRFVAEELQADQFLTVADESFRSVEFSVVSALGAAPLVDKRQSQPMRRGGCSTRCSGRSSSRRRPGGAGCTG